MFNFIFLHRNWEVDRMKFGRRLTRLAFGNAPFTLIIFPEGTTICPETMTKSRNYAEKMGLANLDHVLVPRVTGMQFALNTLGEEIGGIFDLTIGYSGTLPSVAPEETYKLGSLFLEGKGPSRIHVHVKYYPISQIPYKHPEEFSRWLYDRFADKDRLMKYFYRNGHFQGAKSRAQPVAPRHSMFIIILAAAISTVILCAGVAFIFAYLQSCYT